jgi:adenylate cyclase
MATEIERKFLIDPKKLPPLPKPMIIKQGYIPADEVTVRVRLIDEKAFLTLKGKTDRLTRSEFEYPVPRDDAVAMLGELCAPPLIEKKRYRLLYEGHVWEVDIFEGGNRGLFLAEVELGSEEESVTLPPWVIKEVSYDRRYSNANLRLHPFSEFSAGE